MSSVTIPVTLTLNVTIDVHTYDDGRILAEVREYPGCLAYADSEAELYENVRQAIVDWFSEPGVKTEQTARELAAIQGSGEIPEGPYPERRPYQPPPSWTEADEDN